MNYLLDTHLLLWAAAMPDRLSPAARSLLEDPQHSLIFSAASIWEVAIKKSLNRPDFTMEPGVLRRGLLHHGYVELPIGGDHAVAVERLPPLHKDPFDRMLVAQAAVEGITLLTADPLVAQYPGLIQAI